MTEQFRDTSHLVEVSSQAADALIERASVIDDATMLAHLREIEAEMPDVFSEGDARQLQALEAKLGIKMGEGFGEQDA